MTDATSPPTGARPGPTGAALALGGIVLAAGAVGAWLALGDGGPAAEVGVEGAPRRGASYVAPTRMSASTATLSSTAGGATLEVEVSGVAPDDTFFVRLRDTRQDPRRPLVFIDRGPPTTDVGVLAVEVAPVGDAGARRLKIAIPVPVDRVTLVDLRSSGRWEGFEVEASAAR